MSRSSGLLGRFLLRVVSPRGFAASLVGDLDEIHAWEMSEMGGLRAHARGGADRPTGIRCSGGPVYGGGAMRLLHTGRGAARLAPASALRRD